MVVKGWVTEDTKNKKSEVYSLLNKWSGVKHQWQGFCSENLLFFYFNFSELWNITLVLCTQHNILSFVKVYPSKENQTEKLWKGKFNLIKSVYLIYN